MCQAGSWKNWATGAIDFRPPLTPARERNVLKAHSCQKCQSFFNILLFSSVWKVSAGEANSAGPRGQVVARFRKDTQSRECHSIPGRVRVTVLTGQLRRVWVYTHASTLTRQGRTKRRWSCIKFPISGQDGPFCSSCWRSCCCSFESSQSLCFVHRLFKNRRDFCACDWPEDHFPLMH